MLGFSSIGEFALAELGGLANPNATITDTDVLQLPINCIMAGQQLYRDRYREDDLFAPRLREGNKIMKTSAQLKGPAKPSFTVRTDKRGYD